MLLVSRTPKTRSSPGQPHAFCSPTAACARSPSVRVILVVLTAGDVCRLFRSCASLGCTCSPLPPTHTRSSTAPAPRAAAPESIRVELSSESNLFFHFVHDLDADSYAELQESQKLMVEFAEYPTVLLRMLNSCIKEPHTHLAVFNVEAEEGGSRLDFICNMEYKFVELLSLNFEESSEDLVRQHVTFRYNAVKSRLAMMQARLADVNAIVRVKVRAPTALLRGGGWRKCAAAPLTPWRTLRPSLVTQNPSLLLTLQQSAGASAGPKKGVGR